MIQVWNTKRWGSPFGGGWIDWPANMLNSMNAASTYNDAFQSYKSAFKKAEWSRSNGAAWAIVSRYLSAKMEIK